MQRFQSIILALLAVLSLSSCFKVEPLEPAEILKRSIIRNASMESASFSASVFFHTKGYTTFSGSAVAQGVIRGSGGWSADISFEGHDSERSRSLESGKMSVVSIDGNQIFLKPESLQGPLLESIAKNMTGSLNGWWSVGMPLGTTTGRSSMSPSQLNQIASLFLITSSSSPEKFLAGNKAYRINVSVLPDAVITLFADLAKENTVLTGTLWIDSKNFALRRASWMAQDILTPLGPADLVIDVRFSESNSVPDIKVPTGSSGVLSLNSVFATILH